MFKSILLTGVLLLATTVAEAGTIEMKVNGLVCAFCAQGIEKTFRKNPAVVDVMVSLEDRLVAVQTKDGAEISDQELRDTLTNAGYDVKNIERTETPVAAIRERLKRPVK
jgi:periplasmic mercuric ion binding protein